MEVVEMDNKEARQDFVQGLRDLAGWFEQHEEVRLPDWSQRVVVFPSGDGAKEELATIARAMGSSKKEYVSDMLSLRKDFGAMVTLLCHSYREEVCERVVVGTKTLPAEPEQFIPAKPEREEEIVEWKCSAILAPEKEEVEVNAAG